MMSSTLYTSITPANDQTELIALRQLITKPPCGYGSLANQAEYCIKDPAFIDPIIHQLIERFYQGKLPQSAAEREELIAYAKTDYASALLTPDGLSRLESLLEKRHSNPVIRQEGNTLTVDFGYLPGRLSAGPRQQIRLASSAHLEAQEWRSSEVATHLFSYLNRYPNATQIALQISLADNQQTRWTYLYHRQQDRLLVYNSNMPTGAYQLSAPLASRLPDLRTGKMSLHTQHLRWVKAGQV